MSKNKKSTAANQGVGKFRRRSGKAKKPIGPEIKLVSKLKGLKDIMPDDYRHWHLVKRKATELAKLYGYQRFDLPLLESTGLYEKICGKNSEMVSKELYHFLTKANERIALRPDALPGFLRAAMEHNILNQEAAFKSFWLGPVIRYDKSQGGRLRQFNQFSLNILGQFGPAADVQLILLGYNFFKELQVDIEVEINNLGCKDCRQAYLEVIKDYFRERGRRAKLSAEARKILARNPLQILDCREEKAQEVISHIPPVVDHLCANCHQRFEVVLDNLDNLGIPYNLNTSLVSTRGFDCYNGTIFEFTPLVEGGRQPALGGGGNFSQLVRELTNRDIMASGFGIDLEKTISKIRGKNIALANNDQADIFIAQIGEAAKRKAMLLFEELRRAGFKVREDFIQDSLKLQLEEAEKAKVKYALIIGQKELMDNTWLIRDMESGVQETIDSRKLINELDKRLNIS